MSTLFLQIEDDNSEIIRVAALDNSPEIFALDEEFDQLLDEWKDRYGYRPEELDR